MKIILTLFSLIISSVSFADSVNFRFSKIAGELKVDQADFKVTSMTVVARNQFCNFWGTTCAGGPSETKEIPVQFKEDSGTNLVSFTASGHKMKTSKFSNRFSSCNLSVKVAGETSQGKKLYGSINLIWENNKSVCESVSAIDEQIAEKLKVPALVKLIPYNW